MRWNSYLSFSSVMSEVETWPLFQLSSPHFPVAVLLVTSDLTSLFWGPCGDLKAAVHRSVRSCPRRWKRSVRLIPSDFLVTRWAKLCLMNALMGSVYWEECRTGCPCGSRLDIITQICQGQRAPLLPALQHCLYHFHTWAQWHVWGGFVNLMVLVVVLWLL